MPTIRKKTTRAGDVRYEAQVRLRGAPPASATFTTRRAAERWGHATERELRDRRSFGAVHARRYTLADAIDRYLELELGALSPTEQPRRAAQLRRWRAELGHLLLADVTPADVADVRDRLAEHVGPARVNRYLAALARLFSVARRTWYWCEHNPAADVTRRKEPPGRRVFLTSDQAAELLRACHDADPRDLEPLVALALGTGARAGELLALTWPDVELYASPRVTFRATKNGTDRTCPLAGRALELLRERSRVRLLGEPRVFHRPFPRDAYERARRRAGLEHVRFHDLRHTFASWLAMSGATLPELADALGHKTLAMVRRYAHFTAGHTAAVVTRALERFGLA